MSRPLRDDPRPRARRGPLGRRRRDDVFAPLRSPHLDLTPRGLRLDRTRRVGFRPRGSIDWTIALITASALLLAGWLGWSFWKSTRVHVQVAGLESGTPFQPEAAEQLTIEITLPKRDDRFRSSISVDGVDLSRSLKFEDETLVIRPAALVEDDLLASALNEGEHRIRLTVGRVFLSDSTFEWTYVIDSQPPLLDLPSALDPVPVDQAVTVRGRTEPDATLTLDGEPLEHDDGEFAVEFEHPPAGALRFVAVDPAGNRTEAVTSVPVDYPEDTRAVHVSAAAWRDDALRTEVLRLVDEGRVDAVQLDLKDEAGVIGYDSQLAEARRIGAVRPEFDLAEAVEELESRGVRVIGRIVAFRDPIYAQAAWADGRRDAVLQTPDGDMLGAYGGFANYMDPEVRQYNIDIALEAVALGVDDILWDYVRRPEGHPSTMLVPGLGDGRTTDAIVDFLHEAHVALRAQGAYQGASVFGIAAMSGDSIGQDVPGIARVVDYIAPMVYPSHWGKGQYRVPDPIRQPYDITYKSLEHFLEVTEGSGTRIVPWLQDFSLYGVSYGEAEVRAQIQASRDLGLPGFILWDPLVTYTASALDPVPRG